eukprot:scaffold191794_cov17-Prasinocladus_malaysianus.AAC.2
MPLLGHRPRSLRYTQKADAKRRQASNLPAAIDQERVNLLSETIRAQCPADMASMKKRKNRREVGAGRGRERNGGRATEAGRYRPCVHHASVSIHHAAFPSQT